MEVPLTFLEGSSVYRYNASQNEEDLKSSWSKQWSQTENRQESFTTTTSFHYFRDDDHDHGGEHQLQSRQRRRRGRRD